MENKNILDFIQKLQSAIGGKNGASDSSANSSENENRGSFSAEESKNNRTAASSDCDNRKTGANVKKTNVSVFPSYAADEKNEKSFLKTYNPFGEVLQNRPQVSAPRAKMKPKEKIDLSSSRNLASDKKSDVSKNMLDLINKHNRISSELKKRGD